MKSLYLLRAPAGAGKSTWVSENGLSAYTLSADDIRLLFQSPITKSDGSLAISSKHDKDVWDLIFSLVEKRMQRGELTIVDATHARAKFINKYRDLAKLYRYRIFIIEFSVSLEETLVRNKSRVEHKRVPEDVIYNMYAQISTQPVPSWTTKVTPEEALHTIKNIIEPIDFSEYKAIHHIGDIHGSFDALQKFFIDVGFNADELYIFIGDLLDRGNNNGEVFEFMYSIKDEKNVIILEGNHEIHFWNWGNDLPILSKEFAGKTLAQLEEYGITKENARELYRRVRQVACYYYEDKMVLVTHGGLTHIPTPLMPTIEFVKGVGRYEDVDTVHATFANKYQRHNIIQIHGHRNNANAPITTDNVNYNLCDKVEYGGYLRVVTLQNGEIMQRMYKSDSYESTGGEHITPVYSSDDVYILISKLRASPYVVEKRLTDSISSFNFTRSAFYDKHWDDLTVLARGLFINTRTGKIVARGYEKFFNVGENENNGITALANKLEFPVEVYTKENGFLGIVGYDEASKELFIASKTTNEGPFKEWFEQILLSETSKENLLSVVSDGYTLLFEVIDIVNDPHIIEYDRSHVVLLDVVKNSLEFSKLEYTGLLKVADYLGVAAKKHVDTLETWEQFMRTLNYVEDVERQTEGIVFEDVNNYMVKFKYSFYNTWKYLRTLKDRVANGRVVDTSKLINQTMNLFYAWVLTQNKEYVKEADIITLRNRYIRSKTKKRLS